MKYNRNQEFEDDKSRTILGFISWVAVATVIITIGIAYSIN